MSNGFVHVRAVDAIRYPIEYEFCSNNTNIKYFFIYNNSKIYINCNLDLTKLNTIILDQSTNYEDYKTNASKGFPYITINGIQVENKKLINLII